VSIANSAQHTTIAARSHARAAWLGLPAWTSAAACLTGAGALSWGEAP
jgi:hypothetical protein